MLVSEETFHLKYHWTLWHQEQVGHVRDHVGVPIFDWPYRSGQSSLLLIQRPTASFEGPISRAKNGCGDLVENGDKVVVILMRNAACS
jgi:hypothetical protein